MYNRIMNTNVRKVTNLLIDMMDEGALDAEQLAVMCLQYMSEADVADMARSNDLIIDEEEE